ncbi:MAG TPA: histidine kinase [Steroidobacteraceae bacterium]|nr:histidine kinase [Steroidobacteraceae bacterium]
MSAVTSERSLVAPAYSSGLAASLRQSVTVGVKIWPLLGVLTSFWIYVALSNVLYAHSMQASFASMSPGHYFAPWDARVLQHLMLYPILVGCVLLSLRTGWQPAWRAVPAQLSLGLAFSILAAPALVIGEILVGHSDWKHDSPATLQSFMAGPEPTIWLASATSFLLTYGFALALVTGLALYQRFRDAQLRSAALERALTSAHLAALRMQLSPHTLFNLLHTIRGQIGWDPSAAQSMIVQLGDLLRRLLTAGEHDFSRLADELKFARLYLELQQRRFADRLTLWIADLDGLPSLWVPSLILQPLIENAVVHGLAGHSGAVEIRVEAAVCGDNLWLRVINTLAPNSIAGHDGIGVRNVRERLAVQFADRATFSSAAADPGTWIAEIRMPLLRDGPG